MTKKDLKELIQSVLGEYTGTGASGGNSTDGNDIPSPRPFADDEDEMDDYIYKNVYGAEGNQTSGMEKNMINPNRHRMGMFELKKYIKETLKEQSKGLWHNIRAKRKSGRPMAKKGSKAYKSAKKAGDKINKSTKEIYYIESIDEIQMIEDALNEIDEGRKKGKCKPSKGKRFAKRVDGKCRSFGQKGKAKGGGDRIRPGTAKGHAYCARSAKIKKCKNPPCANALSRKKWKCQGSRSVPEQAYGHATLTTQGQQGSRFTKTGRPPGIWEGPMSTSGIPDEIYLKDKLVPQGIASEYDKSRGRLIIYPDLNELKWKSRSSQEIVFTLEGGEIHFVRAFGYRPIYDELKKVLPKIPSPGTSMYSGFINILTDDGSIPVDMDTAKAMIEAMRKGKEVETGAQSSYYTREPGRGGTGIDEKLTDKKEKIMKKPSLKEAAFKLGYLNEAEYGKYFGGRTKGGDPRRPKDIEFDNAQAMDKLTSDDRDKVGKIQQMMRGERKEYEKVTFVYTEQGGRFYGLDVYENKDQKQRSDKLKYDDANEWLKGVLEYIYEDDLIPRRYNSGIEDLDLIVERLEELGIEASHGDYMDVS